MRAKSASDSNHPPKSYARGAALSKKAHALIPGGCHTYAKGDDQFPEAAPGFIVRGQGCHVWDVDGNEFIEYGMGLRAVSLGHAFRPVVEAVEKQIQLGANFVRPATIEVEAAEAFLGLIRGADMVKFTKDGSAALDGAVKLARAHTGRDMVAICGDHPFFSSSDWFIGSTGMPGGIPEWVRAHTVKFRYNSLASLEELFAAHVGKISCVVMEASKGEEPAEGYLERVHALCRQEGALFVLDEMITGFRWHLNGAQRLYGIEPDLSSFGKALGNGFAVSALAGKREFMQLGGVNHEHERVFLLSTTHGAETHALAAAIAVIRTYETEPVIETLYARGDQLRQGIARTVAELKLEDHFTMGGRSSCLVYGTLDEQKRPSQPFRTLFLQELLRRGILAPSFAISYSHGEADVRLTIDAVSEALWVYRRALDEGIGRFLVGRPVKPVFRRFA